MTKSKRLSLQVIAHWDAEARVWWAESDDIPGLVTEAPSFEALVDRILEVAPDLLKLNGVAASDHELPLHVKAWRVEKIRPTRWALTKR
ncbi:MAG TPA: DUF1902 domain-containing protein [Stellaceae bacterium]|nr:DUF1902 domain-containing protein [Stellaceae bacterium]